MSAPRLITPPTAWPLTLAEAKLHLRVDGSDEDALITLLIQAATQDAEAELHRAILPQTYRQQLDGWAGEVLSLGPATVTGITSISYIDSAGAAQALDSSAWILDADDLSARLVPAYGTSWPSVRSQPGAVTITYTAGSWATPAEVPALITAWIRLRIGDLYACRETTADSRLVPLPYAARLLDRWRVYPL